MTMNADAAFGLVIVFIVYSALVNFFFTVHQIDKAKREILAAINKLKEERK